MPAATISKLDSQDVAGFQAALACYWKANLGVGNIMVDPALDDIGVIQFAARSKKDGDLFVKASIQQFQQCLFAGHVIVAKNAAGKTIGVASYMPYKAQVLGIDTARDDYVGLINFFKLHDFKGDVETGKSLVIAALDLISQRGIRRIAYGKSIDEDPSLLSIDALMGPEKQSFLSHRYSGAPDNTCLVVAGINEAYKGMKTPRIGPARPAILTP
ncbi:MAG: hypothetical protein SFW65_04490 [Alphaproteobacteria bacterium]|nr:hypothetical protein [Alphaproteobacteria bacterium]